MSFSQSLYDANFGTAWHTQGKFIGTLMVYTTYAGNPTNNVTPDFIGQECLDTVNGDFYKATTLVSSGWKKLTP